MSMRNWSLEWTRAKAKEASEARYARMQELNADPDFRGDPLNDQTYVRMRLREECLRNSMIFDQAAVIAYEMRDRNAKTLGKQYGQASREIRRLRGEIALRDETIRKLQRGEKA